VLSVFVLIGAVFSPLAAVVAFLITYEEYSHHGFDRRELVRHSLMVAAVTFAAFMLLLVVVGLLLNQPAAGIPST